jgi:uncharacterized protein involved in tolerance to divalent cations
VPEIVAVAAERVEERYAKWVREETGSPQRGRDAEE